MLSIVGQSYAEIKIDGGDLPGGFNVISSVDVCASTMVLCPTMAMTISDRNSVLSRQRSLTDGNPISVTLAKSYDDPNMKRHDFRLFGHRTPTVDRGQVVRIVGIIDAPKYVNSSPSKAYVGTSEEVLRAVATECGLSFSGPNAFNGKQMDDSQTWLAVGKKYCQFAHEVARHGFMDETSGMILALTSQGELRYRNVIDVLNQPLEKIQTVFAHGVVSSEADTGRNVVFVREVGDANISGYTNSWMNYGSSAVTNKIDGDESIAVESGVDIKTTAKALPINAEAKAAAPHVRVDYSPRDAGNVHEKYERGLFQNLKVLGLMSQKLSLLCDYASDVELLDAVIYRQAGADYTQPVKQTDVYLVVGKTLVLRGGRFYAERIEIAKIGVTMEGEAELSGTSLTSKLPDTSFNLSGAAGGLLGKAKSLADIGNNLSQATARVQSAASSVTSAVNAALSPVANAINAIDSAVDSVEQTVQGAISAAEGVYESVEGFYRSMESQYKDLENAIAGIPEGINSSLSEMLATASGGAMEAVSSCIPALNQSSIFGKTMNKLKDRALTKVSDKLSDSTSGKLDAVTDKLQQQADKVHNKFADVWNKTGQLAENKIVTARPSDAVGRIIDDLDAGAIADQYELKDAVKNEVLYGGSANGVDFLSVSSAVPEPISAQDGIDRLRASIKEDWFDA